LIHGIDAAVPLPPQDFLTQRLSLLSGLYGWAFLTTCNRTEFIAWAAPELIESGLLQHAFHLPSKAYAYHGPEAMRHLTYVLAGLKAKMIGEFHIVGQVRDAMETAREKGWANGQLLRTYAEALQRSQSLRTIIAPYIPQIEVEDLALEGTSGRIVIAGTGALGKATLAKARAMGLEVVMLYHHTPIEGVDCRPLSQWQEAVRGATRFISALTVTEPYFDAHALGIPAYDLGAPRNITGENVRDLDALRGDYLTRTGAIDTILSIADTTYAEISRD
jgi:glutamyl-tRNA reductase